MKLNYPLIKVPSLDKKIPQMFASRSLLQLRIIVKVKQLAKFFKFKKNSMVMLTTNISIHDRLVHGQLGTIVDTKQDSSGILNKIHVKSQDENAGLTEMRSDRYASENIVPIARIEANFSVS